MIKRTEEMKVLTNDFYDNFALKYWKSHAESPKASIERFAQFLPDAASFICQQILDLGCGGGRDALLFRSMGFNPVCADLSWVMCQEARRQGLSAVFMDQEELGFASESFSGVWARNSLLHTPPELMPKIIEDLRRILKRNGILYLGMKASLDSYTETELKTIENDVTYYCYWPLAGLCHLLDNLGFEVEEANVQGKDTFNQRNLFEIFAVKE